ncbi:integrase core domain-containing protein [Rhodococcus koreensis]|uniref:integrase core domain-containing protein n=1 Tax=Rhodococcus koreensis TaxID=99653 RepID=UPI001981C5C2|nr:transposase [Rhodococcus koreensis]
MLQQFCRARVGISYIPPGTPWNSGHIESFNNLRKECLNRNHWTSLLEARVVVEDFKDDHNHRHRRSSLGYLTPAWESLPLAGRTLPPTAPTPTNRWTGARSTETHTIVTLERRDPTIGDMPDRVPTRPRCARLDPSGSARQRPSRRLANHVGFPSAHANVLVCEELAGVTQLVVDAATTFVPCPEDRVRIPVSPRTEEVPSVRCVMCG